jgi:hypothetical protein
MDLGVRGEYEQNILFIKMPKRERKRKAAAKPGGGGERKGENNMSEYRFLQKRVTARRKTNTGSVYTLELWHI